MISNFDELVYTFWRLTINWKFLKIDKSKFQFQKKVEQTVYAWPGNLISFQKFLLSLKNILLSDKIDSKNILVQNLWFGQKLCKQSNQIVNLHEKIFKCQIEFKIEQTGSIQGVGERAPVHCNAWIGQLIWNKPATAQSYDSIYYSAVKMKSVAPSQIFKKRYRTNNYLINIYDL